MMPGFEHADPTDLAIMAAMPILPVPPSGRSPAIDELRAAHSGQGVIYGREGPMLILRRAWLELDMALNPEVEIHMPYGSTGPDKLDLRCGFIPGHLLEQIAEHFVDALPNEAAAFVVWDEETREFFVHEPTILDASPSRLSYLPPALPAHQHVVVDIHSHAAGPAFFSRQDNEDDIHSTKIAMVMGGFRAGAERQRVTTKIRICAAGALIPIKRSPFRSMPDAES